jgi:hypothetical protein
MGLRIVQYDPNDYKLGEALALASGESVEDSEKISQILSLYFQWKESALCWAYTTKDKSARSKALLSYDEEERVATQLFVEVDKSALSPGAEWVFLRLEIFENCFEFESRALDWFDENGKTIAIIEIPKSASVVKNRRFPRVAAIGDSTLSWSDDTGKRDFKIINLSLGSVIVKGEVPNKKPGVIHLANISIPATSIRSFDGKTSIKLELANNFLVGAWFDFYRQHAYPQLRKRSELPADECIQLYKDSGYFDKYKANDLEGILQRVGQSWKDYEPLEHQLTADYAVMGNERPVGIGSTSFTYKNHGKEFWTFHSLCALKNSDDLDKTFDLYAWRAEYNFARVENIDTLLFFASSSRWIERVYINFILRKQSSNVMPIRLYTMTLSPKNHQIKVDSIPLGIDCNRLMIMNEGFTAAALPDLLHIRQRLNCIDVTSSTVTREEIIAAGEQIAFTAGLPITFRISLQIDHPWEPEVKRDLPGDRLGILRKEDLIDFIASLKHSIEVTKRKKNLA